MRTKRELKKLKWLKKEWKKKHPKNYKFQIVKITN